MNRRRVLRWTAVATALFSLVTAVSVVRYVLAHPTEPLQQNLASWAREQGLGGIVDRLEIWLHDEPPSAAPASSLALAVDDVIDGGTDAAVSATTSPPVQTTVSASPVTARPATPTTLEAATPAVTNPNARPVKLSACGTPVPTTTTVVDGAIPTRPSTTSTSTIDQRPIQSTTG